MGRGDLRQRSDRDWQPVTSAAVVIVSLVYFFTGWQKLLISGASWVTSENLSWVLAQGSIGVTGWRRDTAMWVAQSGFLPHLLAAITLLVELGFPVAIVWRRVRVPLCLAVCGLHASIWLFVGLEYSAWVGTAICVLALDAWLHHRVLAPEQTAEPPKPLVSPTLGTPG